jgi:hypothetical protein
MMEEGSHQDMEYPHAGYILWQQPFLLEIDQTYIHPLLNMAEFCVTGWGLNGP